MSRVSGTHSGTRQSITAAQSTPARFSREETAAIPQWARDHGHQVSDRGRISKSIMEAYQAAS